MSSESFFRIIFTIYIMYNMLKYKLNPLLGKSDRIFLKGMAPDREYLIESRLGCTPARKKTGAEWMKEGVWLENVRPGEVLYINLPDRPGTGSLREKPQAPENAALSRARWLNRDGVAIQWTAPEKDDAISYYEIARDGEPFTKVSIGTYYFDGGLDGSARYAVRSVDFDGQTSQWTPCVPLAE